MRASPRQPALDQFRSPLTGVSVVLLVALVVASGLGAGEARALTRSEPGSATTRQCLPEIRRIETAQTRRQDHKPLAGAVSRRHAEARSAGHDAPSARAAAERTVAPTDRMPAMWLSTPPPAAA
ncbi:MAG: hypothetical protein JNJ48_02615 [Phycisphaerae bacterium]|nr:hypothetical protein [Phycisphaerae bacterium]